MIRRRRVPSGVLAGSLATVCLCAIAATPSGATGVQDEPEEYPSASFGGVLLDAANDAPVVGAIISLAGDFEISVTDAEGRFLLFDLVPGRRIVEIHFGDRPAAPRAVHLEPERHTEVRIQVEMAAEDHAALAAAMPVEADVVPLPELDVDVRRHGKLAEFERRRVQAHGAFITREEILDRSPSRMSDMVRRIAGVQRGRGRYGRESLTIRDCAPAYVLDGVPAPGLDIDDIPPHEVAGVEVYRGPSEIPSQYKRRAQCALIIIWTRDPAVRDPD